MLPIPINLAVEDALSDAVARKLLAACARDYAIGAVYTRGGFGYLKRIAPGLNYAAKGTPFLLLTDLDDGPCPSGLISDWVVAARHHNFLFRVAVREVEAWVLADRQAFAKFLGIKEALVPENVDELDDPKKTLLLLTAKSPKKDLRRDLLPRKGSTSTIGPNYNGRLTQFVVSAWDALEAGRRSPSLARTLARLQEFKPLWQADEI